MSVLTGLRLGRRTGPYPAPIDADMLRRFATATNDPSPRVQAGQAVPPTAVVTRSWEAQEASRAEHVPLAFQLAARGGVHGAHDVRVLRPVVPGEELATWVEGFGTRVVGPNSLVTLRYLTLDRHGSLVAEQLWTTVWLGVRCEEVGERPPDHSLPDQVQQSPLGTWTLEVDEGMAHRYAEVSGDWSPHHFDPEAARRSGFEGVFVHGLCTMALCVQGVAHLVAGGDAERITRVALRFTRPVRLGAQLDVHLYDAGRLGYAFEARSMGVAVITHGRAEVR